MMSVENLLQKSVRTLDSWIELGLKKKSKSGLRGLIWISGDKEKNSNELKKRLGHELYSWARQKSQSIVRLTTEDGPIWWVRPHLSTVKKTKEHQGLLAVSTYALFRDTVGACVSQLDDADLQRLEICLSGLNDEAEMGAFVGFEVGAYRFAKLVAKEGLTTPAIEISGSFDKENLRRAQALGAAVNLARHLTNLPPNALNPVSYANFVKKLFNGRTTLKVEVWDEKRLEKEKMGLHVGVGAGSQNPPRLVCIRYRPKKKSDKKTVALVGKGVTFDSGGLDLKPAAGMRWMKKDMGGSASVLGACLWAELSQADQPIDAYLALAENMVDERSFRPGDVLFSRNGTSVEISNTDAEGRLVLADALNIASESKPAAVIDVATLTGAVKVGLGSEVAGLFCNRDSLSRKLEQSAQAAGEPCWRMPLWQKYRGQMKSTFADMQNSVESSFGGAVTAALFLESFVNDSPWAHFDIYAWKDGPDGAINEAGGSGQMVQTLAFFLDQGRVS